MKGLVLMRHPIDASTRLYGLLAHPSRHSISPAMHNTAFQALGLNCVYLSFDIDAGGLPAAVEALRCGLLQGANVSMPNKVAVMEHLDEIAPEAALAGAVNTIVREDGKLVGHNTDGDGWLRGIREAGVDLRGQKLTLVGTGGAAKAILATAALHGAGEIALFNRRSGRWPAAQMLAAQVQQRTGCPVHLYELNREDPACVDRLGREIGESALLTNATNVGMGTLAGQTWLPETVALPPMLLVSDVIYNPAETELLCRAKQAGCRVQNGGPMVLYQGAVAFRYWTGQEMPLDVVRPVMGLS